MMDFVSSLMMFLLVVVAIFLILLILIQRGRGGGLAGAFGGMGGQSAFGTKAGDVFTRITIGTATVWILLCAASVKILGSGESRFRSDLGSASEKLNAAPTGGASGAANAGKEKPTSSESAPAGGATPTGDGAPAGDAPGASDGATGSGTPSGDATPADKAPPADGGAVPAEAKTDAATKPDAAGAKSPAEK
jgi:preprotein translocase subunit SecG